MECRHKTEDTLTLVVETQGLEAFQKAATRDELNGVKLRFLQESEVPDARAAQHPQVVTKVSQL